MTIYCPDSCSEAKDKPTRWLQGKRTLVKQQIKKHSKEYQMTTAKYINHIPRTLNKKKMPNSRDFNLPNSTGPEALNLSRICIWSSLWSYKDLLYKDWLYFYYKDWLYLHDSHINLSVCQQRLPYEKCWTKQLHTKALDWVRVRVRVKVVGEVS